MLTAEELIAVVRVHADRVHDAVRRLGCAPEAAVHVVQASGLDLVQAAAHRPAEVHDPVAWWFTRARALGRRAGGGVEDVPVGGGVLGGDENQVRIAEALEGRPERERAALLLRDSYDLPASTVALVLGLDTEAATELVAQARMGFLPQLTAMRAFVPSDHLPRLAALARLAEGGQHAAKETQQRRHVESCDACAAALDTQERARRVLSGLTVVALPDADRERILAQLDEQARTLLPAAELPAAEASWEEAPRRGYSLSLMALGLVVAVGAGIGAGALMSRGTPTSALTVQHELPLVTAAPVLSVGPRSAAPAAPTSATSPRVFQVTPSPTPTPTNAASASPSPDVAPATIALDPTSGPRDTVITVTGRGWTPGATVTLVFATAIGGQSGAATQATADATGAFTATLPARDGANTLPGGHKITADDGTHHAEATFDVTG